MNNAELIGIVSQTVKRVLETSVEKIENVDFEMTLKIAKTLSEVIEKKAEKMGVNVVVAVANSGARPILVNAMDNSYIASYDIALNKAYTSVSLKMATKDLKKISQPGGELYGVQFTNNGQIVIFGGGVPLLNGEKVIGGLGVSGGTEEQDTFLADYGREVFEKIAEELFN